MEKAASGKPKDEGGASHEDRGPVATPSEPPVFDRDNLISRLMDDEELAREVVALFLADTPNLIGELQAFLAAGDAASAERHAHSIKGSASNVGGESLRAEAYEIEKAVKVGDLAAALARLPALEAKFRLFAQAATAEFGK